MKRNVCVVRFKFRCNILISGKIIKEMPGSVASGTHCTSVDNRQMYQMGKVLLCCPRRKNSVVLAAENNEELLQMKNYVKI